MNRAKNNPSQQLLKKISLRWRIAILEKIDSGLNDVQKIHDLCFVKCSTGF